MLELDHAGDRRWTARFDPQSNEFLAGPVPPERTGIDVPLSALGDLKRLGRWIRLYSPTDEVIARLEDVQQRLLDYSLPAYIVETDDEQALRGVFARLNSTGARMRADEVFQALLGAPSSESHTSLDLDALQSLCDADGFGTPERAEVLKAVLAMSGLDPARRLDDFVLNVAPELVSRDEASEALSRTVAFLMEECGIAHVSLIPYPVVFFILARWFHVYPHCSEPTRRMLARWVWRSAVTGAHQRAAVSQMREQVRAIESGGQEEQASLDRLLAHTGRPSNGGWELKSFHLKSARSRIETLAMLRQHPRDRLGSIRVAELLSNGRIAREIFRAEDCKHLSSDGQKLARTAANRVLLGTVHTGLSSELSRWSWPQDQEALGSLLIDQEAFELLRSQDAEGFLRRRAGSVVTAVQKLVRQCAAWDEPIIRPLSVYQEDALSL